MRKNSNPFRKHTLTPKKIASPSQGRRSAISGNVAPYVAGGWRRQVGVLVVRRGSRDQNNNGRPGRLLRGQSLRGAHDAEVGTGKWQMSIGTHTARERTQAVGEDGEAPGAYDVLPQDVYK